MAGDQIEQMVEDWARERPDLDAAAIALLARVSRLAHRFDEAQRSGIAALGLKPGWLDALAALRRAGPPYRLSPTALAAATLLTSGGMTSRLDRLEEAGLVRRKADPADRRGVIVELTAEGRRVTDAAIDEHGELGERLLMPLGRNERQTLLHLLRKLLAALEEPESSAKDVAPEPLTASWIPRSTGRTGPRDSARRGRRPRAERRGPSR
jgi:DNA-binding MarR family transcriptional regulator